MSCLAPAPLSDLVTRDFLTSELSRFATKKDLAGLEEKVGSLEGKVGSLDAKVGSLEEKVGSLEEKVGSLEEKVEVLAAQHADDRATSRVRHYWLAGIGLSAVVSIWLDAVGVIG